MRPHRSLQCWVATGEERTFGWPPCKLAHERHGGLFSQASARQTPRTPWPLRVRPGCTLAKGAGARQDASPAGAGPSSKSDGFVVQLGNDNGGKSCGP
ncbi:hypothetical protein GQ55_2G333200 [Panicum hallii var. hallii]|uniref:Uncharacterized protein n=1 Tax=Panicum hallii var. hallii TaxID=1504633 RepID=A0A2T7EV31_9POAL|nr:hypothetical protein GQ55_2G333200 [Panicum hallii var. hallii]